MRLARKQLKIRTAEYDRMANLGVFDADRPHTELLAGHIYEMPPIGTPHLIVVTRPQHRFERPLNEEVRVLVQQPLIVDKFNEPQPDVVVLREPLRRRPRAEDSLVVIEVSDTTYDDDDRKVKLPAYLAGGVPLVWIVNLRQGVLEEYSPSGSRVYRPGEQPPTVAGVSVDLAWLLADLPSDG
jgi:Uma2 family endonuclease